MQCINGIDEDVIHLTGPLLPDRRSTRTDEQLSGADGFDEPVRRPDERLAAVQCCLP
jgi:hypothetical protein